MPEFIKPQLATLKPKAPRGDQWLNEIKYDGYRVQLHANDGRRTVYTRNGLDWTKRFSGIARAFDVPGQAIVDGEAVVIEDGRTNFSELQAALGGGRQGRIEYYAFDLLYLDGFDLRAVSQIERKRLLKELFESTSLSRRRATASTSPATARRCSRTPRSSTGRASSRRTPRRRTARTATRDGSR